MVTRNDLVNRASLRIGAGAAQTETPQTAPRYAIYDGVVESLLSKYPWKHCRRTRQLNRLSRAPDHFWQYAFQCPGEMLGDPRAAYADQACNTPFNNWELEADPDNRKTLVTNVTAIWLRYSYRSPETIWPGHFADLVVQATMAEMALSVREDSVLWRQLNERCFGTPQERGLGGLFAQSRSLDAMSEPAPKLAGGASPLVDVRQGGGLNATGWNWRG